MGQVFFHYKCKLKMTDKELLKVVTQFRKGILGKRRALKMCYAICWPLQGYLRIIDFDCKLTEGKIHLSSHNKGISISHFWLTLPDGRIIDPTADQFNKMSGYDEMPPVYLGVKPEYYKPKYKLKIK